MVRWLLPVLVVTAGLVVQGCVDLTVPVQVSGCPTGACDNTDGGDDGPQGSGVDAAAGQGQDAAVERSGGGAEAGPSEVRGSGSPGAPCSDATQCASGFCSDGVCCTSACRGVCEKCDLGGTAGACTAAPAGEDPGAECAEEAATTCGRDGSCNGARACRRHPQGTVCAAASCTGETLTPVSTCDGSGRCVGGTGSSCSGFLCDVAGAACRATCTTAADCAPGTACLNSSCGTIKPLGAPCTAAGQCASGKCQQGVCCAGDCTGTCRSCALAGSAGTCAVVPAGADPHNQCADQGAPSCDNDGSCDGAGGCRRYRTGTVCAGGSCSGSTATSPRTCNGTGTCAAARTMPCDPYLCEGATCRTKCKQSDQCAAGATCVGDDCKSAIGRLCVVDADCVAGGDCEQGICCATTCNGTCRSCALPGSLGTCANVPGGQDPLSQCSDQGAASCGTDGMCDGSGGCRRFPANTACAPASCTAATYTAGSSCNGSGTCSVAAAVNCGKYRCDGSGCLPACSDSADCNGGSVCHTRACGGLKGEYFDGRAFGTLKLTRTDGVIDFMWAGAPAAGLPSDGFSVRWTGKITARFSESYTLFVRVDDGVRLWVGNLATPIIDSWRDQGVVETSGMVALTAGQATDLKLEYYENTSGAAVELLWQSASQARETVPASALTPPQ